MRHRTASNVVDFSAARLLRDLPNVRMAPNDVDLQVYSVGDKVKVLSVRFNDIIWTNAVVTAFNTTTRTGFVTLTSGRRRGVKKHVTAVQLKPAGRVAAANGLA